MFTLHIYSPLHFVLEFLLFICRRVEKNIDGFGITGCEGTYRQSCKEVLRVLRDNSSQLLTILEVVIHDPLYKWSLSPVQARKRQKSQDVLDDDIVARNAAEMNHASESHSFGRDAAERTLLRIKNKLNGFEDPTGEPLGVEGQVELCINEARSYENLSRMFHGWAPWL
jgi:ataxia telangiectasia mutated family protein